MIEKRQFFVKQKTWNEAFLLVQKVVLKKNMMMQKHCEQLSRLEFFSWTLRKKKIIQIMNKKNVQKIIN
jgi:hypothetical protein